MVILLSVVLAIGGTACTGGPHSSGKGAPAPVSRPESSGPSAAPTQAAEVRARVCPQVPLAAVGAFFGQVPSTAAAPKATACRAISNTAAAWANQGSKRPDVLLISVFDRSYGKQCGLTSYGTKIEDFSLRAHSAAVVSRGSAGGLFLCWSSSANRIVLMAVNTPPDVSYASIKGPAIKLADSLVGRL